MKKTLIFLSCILVIVLASCGFQSETNSQLYTPSPSPNITEQPPKTPSTQQPSTHGQQRSEGTPVHETPVGAQINVGSVERYFFSQNLSACKLDRVRGEMLILFTDESSGATLSLRLNQIDTQKNNSQVQLSRNSGEGSVLVALGGVTQRNNFRFQPLATSQCEISYRLVEPQAPAIEPKILGQFRCKDLVNHENITANAMGHWMCVLQKDAEWNF